MVAQGVLPDVCQYPFASAVSEISRQDSCFPDSLRTFSAADIALIFVVGSFVMVEPCWGIGGECDRHGSFLSRYLFPSIHIPLKQPSEELLRDFVVLADFLVELEVVVYEVLKGILRNLPESGFNSIS